MNIQKGAGAGKGRLVPSAGDPGPGLGGGEGASSSPSTAGNKYLTLRGCAMGGGIIFLILAVLAAIALPDFLKFNQRAVQSEVKINLQALFEAQDAYYKNHNTFAGGGPPGSGCFDRLGWEPEGAWRYNYYCDGQVIQCNLPNCDRCPGIEDLSRSGPDSFVIMAAGNHDEDADCDIWIIDGNKKLNNVDSDF